MKVEYDTMSNKDMIEELIDSLDNEGLFIKLNEREIETIAGDKKISLLPTLDDESNILTVEIFSDGIFVDSVNNDDSFGDKMSELLYSEMN